MVHNHIPKSETASGFMSYKCSWSQRKSSILWVCAYHSTFFLGKHVTEIKCLNGCGKAGAALSFLVGLAAEYHRQVPSLIIIISQYKCHHILEISHTPKSVRSPQEKFLTEAHSLCWENWHVQAHFPASLAQADLGPPGYPVRSLADENCQIKLFPSIVTSALFHLQPWLPP